MGCGRTSVGGTTETTSGTTSTPNAVSLVVMSLTPSGPRSTSCGPSVTGSGGDTNVTETFGLGRIAPSGTSSASRLPRTSP